MNPLGRIFGGLRDGHSSRQPRTPETRLQVTNLTRHTVLATCLEVANSGSRRSKGLLGRARLAPGEGLWILPCEAVHTFFMQVPHRPCLSGPQEPNQEDPQRSASVAPVGMPLGALRAGTCPRNHPWHADASRRSGRIFAGSPSQ